MAVDYDVDAARITLWRDHHRARSRVHKKRATMMNAESTRWKEDQREIEHRLDQLHERAGNECSALKSTLKELDSLYIEYWRLFYEGSQKFPDGKWNDTP